MFLGREYEAVTQAALACGWLAQGRVVGGDGVRYRRRTQQAAHYVLNDTIVKSLASCMTEVERGLNMSGAFGNIKATKSRLFWTRMICSVSDADSFPVPMNRVPEITVSVLFILVTLWRGAVAVSTFQSRAEGWSAIGKRVWGLHGAALAPRSSLIWQFFKADANFAAFILISTDFSQRLNALFSYLSPRLCRKG